MVTHLFIQDISKVFLFSLMTSASSIQLNSNCIYCNAIGYNFTCTIIFSTLIQNVFNHSIVFLLIDNLSFSPNNTFLLQPILLMVNANKVTYLAIFELPYSTSLISRNLNINSTYDQTYKIILISRCFLLNLGNILYGVNFRRTLHFKISTAINKSAFKQLSLTDVKNR
jgi:hypothetical protein